MAWSAGAVLTAAQLNTYAPQARTSYTPALAGGSTTGNATCAGSYVQFGSTVHFWARILLGSTSVIASNPTVTLPVTALGAAPGVDGLSTTFNDVSSGNFYFGRGWANGATAQIYIVGTNGLAAGVSSTAPFTWATGDGVFISGTYEAA